MIDQLRAVIPQSLIDHSGVVFNSGRDAFSHHSGLYILGLNPGGAPEEHRHETLRTHTDMVMRMPSNWSSFRDQSLKGKAPGTYRFQPRVLHMLQKLSLDPGQVPASNLVFLRTRNEKELGHRLPELVETCWPFHEMVIRTQRVRAVICMGMTAAAWACRKLGVPSMPVEVYTEMNLRGWQSKRFNSPGGISVIAATHPSIANWTNEKTDPTRLVLNALRAR